MRMIEEANPDYESCADCIYSDDSEEICVLRRCIHAVSRLKECYVPKSSTIERTGKWIDCDGGIATCSACGDRWGVYGVMKFCPNCGAEME